MLVRILFLSERKGNVGLQRCIFLSHNISLVAQSMPLMTLSSDAIVIAGEYHHTDTLPFLKFLPAAGKTASPMVHLAI